MTILRRCASGCSLGVLAWLACACGPAPKPPDPDGPNILLYVSDTLRADALGCYGNRVVATPNVDALAAEGTVFSHALAPSPWTRASMGSILSGTAPAVHGAQGRFDLLEPSVELISEILARAGYATANVTTNRNVGAFFGFDQGWDANGFIELYAPLEDEMVHVHELTTPADEVTRRAIAWLEDAPEPWCLIVHTIDPHSPYVPPAGYDRYGAGIASSVDGSQETLYALEQERSAADVERVRSLYYGEVAFNDAGFGALVAWLRERGLWDRTIGVFTSDHGEEFWERRARGHGKTVNEKALHVPLIVRFPGIVPRERRPEPVSTLDVLPTLLDLAGVQPPAWFEGTPLFAGSPPDPERVLFASCVLGERELFVARRGRWKLVWNAANDITRLYDMEATTPEGVEGPDVAAQHAELTQELLGLIQRERDRARSQRLALHGSARAPRVGELPTDVRDELRKLGYLEGDEGN